MFPRDYFIPYTILCCQITSPYVAIICLHKGCWFLLLHALQARDGNAISSDFAGVIKTWDITIGLCKDSFQTPALGGHYLGDTQMIEGRLISVQYVDLKPHIWISKQAMPWPVDWLWVAGISEVYANSLRIDRKSVV